jgi:iron complex transport system substrate-binding protein
LTPSGTEVVGALGAAPFLVGVDEYSQYPDSVRSLPKVGSFLGPNIEQIVRLKPTLVIVDDVHGQTAGALRDSGIATLECAIQTLPDVKTALHAVGERLGKPNEAKLAIDGIDATLDAVAAKRPAKHPRVLTILDREAGGLGNLVAVGPGSYMDELLAVVGGDNVLAASSIRYPRISLEEVLRSQPEVILDLSFAGKEGGDAWKQVDVPAVKNGKVVALTEDFFQHPSVRVGPALDRLAAAIR